MVDQAEQQERERIAQQVVPLLDMQPWLDAIENDEAMRLEGFFASAVAAAQLVQPTQQRIFINLLKDDLDEPLILFASKFDALHCVEWLVRARANPRGAKCTETGKTPLHYLLRAQLRREDEPRNEYRSVRRQRVIQILVDAGSDLDAADEVDHVTARELLAQLEAQQQQQDADGDDNDESQES